MQTNKVQVSMLFSVQFYWYLWTYVLSHLSSRHLPEYRELQREYAVCQSPRVTWQMSQNMQLQIQSKTASKSSFVYSV
jgi:hypothetical protein